MPPEILHVLTPTTVLAAALGLCLLLLLGSWRKSTNSASSARDAERRLAKERERLALAEAELLAERARPLRGSDAVGAVLSEVPDALRDVARARSQRDLADAVGRAIERLLEPQQWMVFLDTSGDGADYTLVASGSTTGRTWSIGASLTHHTGLVGLAVRRASAMDRSDLAAEPPMVREQVTESEPRDFRVDLAVPFVAAGKVVGVVTVGRSRVAGDAQRALLGIVGECATTSLRLLQVRERVARLENEDEATGLANRSWFNAQASETLFRNRDSAVPVTIAILGIDDFREFATREGPAEGQRLVLDVARALRTCFEQGDLLSRWSEDEFAVLLPGRAKSTAVAFLDEVRRTIADAGIAGGASQPAGTVTLSVGVAALPDDGGRVDDLVEAAYRAFQCSRARGGDITTRDVEGVADEVAELIASCVAAGADAAAAPEEPEDDTDIPASWRV